MNAQTTKITGTSLPTPGAYIRECRARSGRSLAKCASMVAVHAHDRARAESDLAALEADVPGDYLRLVRLLRDRGAFAFSLDTFLLLAAGTADATLDPWAEI